MNQLLRTLSRRQFIGVLIVLMLARMAAFAQAPTWQTARSFTGSGSSIIRATVADAAGNLYMTGNFTGTVQLGSITITAVSNGDGVFIAKYNSVTKDFVWVKQGDGTGGNFSASAIAVSGNNVYVTGGFYAPIQFDNISLTKADPGNGLDVFVVKITDSGTGANFVWATRAGGPSNDEVTGLVVNGANVYIAGTYIEGPALFGNISLNRYNGSAAFVAKINDLGNTANFVWAQQATSGPSGGDGVGGTALAVSGNNIYLAGGKGVTPFTFYNFGGISPTTDNGGNMFIAKLIDAGTSGRFVWVQQAGSSLGGRITALAVNNGNIYAGGNFLLRGQFGSTLLTANSNNAFVTKLTDTGNSSNFVWALAINTLGNDLIRGMAVNGSRVYAAGVTNAEYRGITFGSSRNIFLAGFTDNGLTGRLNWVKLPSSSANSTRAAQGFGVACVQNAVYLVGYISGTVGFDSHLIAGRFDSGSGFVASLTDNAVLATTPTTRATDMVLAPNPAHATSTVLLPPISGTNVATLSLLDALGRSVRTTTVSLPAAGLRHEFNLEGIAAGAYALRVNAGNVTATRRLMVE